MEYTQKHKNLIAKLFKKAGMLEEAEIVLSCDEYKPEISSAMRDAARKVKVPIGATPALLARQGVMKLEIAPFLKSALYVAVKAWYGAIFIISVAVMARLAIAIVI
jgi:hypothetical protein